MSIKTKKDKEEKQKYNKLVRLVDKAEKIAIRFVKNNLANDSELQLKCPASHKLSF